jgi:hypothetical protein
LLLSGQHYIGRYGSLSTHYNEEKDHPVHNTIIRPASC